MNKAPLAFFSAIEWRIYDDFDILLPLLHNAATIHLTNISMDNGLTIR
jgi:hypothetical protein